MKNLKDIIESQNFLVNKKPKTRQDKYEYHPTTKDELKDIIIELLKKGQTNLNCIDVSNIDNMMFLFCTINNNIRVKEIDISEWDVSNVKDMRSMFFNCQNFNSDLSKWNVSNVENMYSMFYNCYKFNCDLSNWDVSNVKYMKEIFSTCREFNSDLSKWDVSNVTNMAYMFWKCEEFNSDLSKWNISNVSDNNYMFFECNKLIENNKIPDWYKGKV